MTSRMPKIEPDGPNAWKFRVLYNRNDTGQRKGLTVHVAGTLAHAKRVRERVMLLRKLKLLGEIDIHSVIEGRIDPTKPGALNVLLAEQDSAEARQTLNEHFESWLVSHRFLKLAEKTRDDYEWTMRHYVLPVLGNVRLNKLTGAMVADLMEGLVKSGKAGRTAELTQATLSSCLKSQVKKIWDQNPAYDHDYVPPEPEELRAKAMHTEEIHRFLDALTDHPLHLALLTMLGTGVRPAELLGFQWKDLDRQGEIHWLSVVRTATHRRGRLVIKGPKSRAGRRTISLPQSLAERLIAYRGAKPLDSWIFDSGNGEPYWDSTLRTHFNDLLEAAGIREDYRPYDLRHTHATQLLRLRYDAGFVSRRLGHRDVAFTLEVYGHVIPGMPEDAAARFESEIMPPLKARSTFS